MERREEGSGKRQRQTDRQGDVAGGLETSLFILGIKTPPR